MMKFARIARDVLLNPKKFFSKEFKRVDKWKISLSYVFFFTVVSTLLLLVQDSYSSRKISQYFPLGNPTFMIVFLLLSVVVLFFLTFFRYWVIHWYVYLYNKKSQYKKTYAALAYSNTPGWFGLPFAVIATVSFVFGGWWSVLGTISGLLFIAFEGYSMYVRTVALSLSQKLKYWQAFLSIYVWGFFTYMILVMVMEFIILTPIFWFTL